MIVLGPCSTDQELTIQFGPVGGFGYSRNSFGFWIVESFVWAAVVDVAGPKYVVYLFLPHDIFNSIK